jgi:hypothetical protein
VSIDERLGTYRFLGSNEVRDDGAQHLEAAVVRTTHRSPPDRHHFTVTISADIHRADFDGGDNPTAGH